jgi:SAM-dependent methyltransferase
MASPSNSLELEFTGERVVPGKTPRLLVLEHLLRYHFAAKFVEPSSRVVDVGCGTGYGAAMLAGRAARVTGIDNAGQAVQYARQNYLLPNLHFSCADCRTLPFRDSSFDRAVMFEVIEHVWEQDSCLNEIRRVLAPDGILILSTPNPAGPTKGVEEPNLFHKKELQQHELLELLRPHFGHIQLLYQHELSASSIEAAGSSHSRSAEVADNFSLGFPPKYFLAVCSHRPVRIPGDTTLALGGIEHQVAILQGFRQMERDLISQRRDIEALLKWREDKEEDYARNIAAHAEVISRLKEEVAARDARLADEAAAREALRDEVATLEKEIALRDAKLVERETEIARRQMELNWLYRWFPFNRLAHRLLYGRNLRRRVLRRLGFRVGA